MNKPTAVARLQTTAGENLPADTSRNIRKLAEKSQLKIFLVDSESGDVIAQIASDSVVSNDTMARKAAKVYFSKNRDEWESYKNGDFHLILATIRTEVSSLDMMERV